MPVHELSVSQIVTSCSCHWSTRLREGQLTVQMMATPGAQKIVDHYMAVQVEPVYTAAR